VILVKIKTKFFFFLQLQKMEKNAKKLSFLTTGYIMDSILDFLDLVFGISAKKKCFQFWKKILRFAM